MAGYKEQTAEVEFSESTAAFEGLREFLASAAAMNMDHETLEHEIDERGREILRRLFQDHLKLRKEHEQVIPTTGSDGVHRTHLRDESRPLMTLFGPVRVERGSVGARGSDSLFPMDAELNLPPEEHSFGVRRRVAIEAAKGSFDEAVEAVTTQTGAGVSKRQAEKLTAVAAQDFDAFYAQRPSAEVRAGEGEIVVLTSDGKGIVVRREDLREATRQAAETTEHRLKKRLSSGEKTNRKRMATVASVYSIGPHVRTPADIVKELRPVQDMAHPPRPKPSHKRVWASVEKDATKVIAEVFDEAASRDPRREHKWAAVVDGNGPQLKAFETEAIRRRVALTIVLDLIHALEYLWSAAYCFHDDGTPEAEAWVTERLIALLNGKVSDVAAGIRRSATKRGLDAPEPGKHTNSGKSRDPGRITTFFSRTVLPSGSVWTRPSPSCLGSFGTGTAQSGPRGRMGTDNSTGRREQSSAGGRCSDLDQVVHGCVQRPGLTSARVLEGDASAGTAGADALRVPARVGDVRVVVIGSSWLSPGTGTSSPGCCAVMKAASRPTCWCGG